MAADSDPLFAAYSVQIGDMGPKRNFTKAELDNMVKVSQPFWLNVEDKASHSALPVPL